MTAQQLREKLMTRLKDWDHGLEQNKFTESLITIVCSQREALERISETISEHPLSFNAPSEGANVASDALYDTDAKLKEMGVL